MEVLLRTQATMIERSLKVFVSMLWVSCWLSFISLFRGDPCIVACLTSLLFFEEATLDFRRAFFRASDSWIPHTAGSSRCERLASDGWPGFQS